MAVYCAVRGVVSITQAPSWSHCIAPARFLGWVAYKGDRRHRLVALENLRHSFPEMAEADRDALVRESYVHWIRVVFEMIRLPRVLRAWNLDQFFSYPRPEDYRWTEGAREETGGVNKGLVRQNTLLDRQAVGFSDCHSLP